MKYIQLFFILALINVSRLVAQECVPVSHVVVGGGYYHAGSHSGGLFQLEYRFAKYFFGWIRPQASLILPKFESLFLGFGVGVEIRPFKHLLIYPTFSPGFYDQGKEGRDLGFPLEFRSSIEFAFEWCNRTSIGVQIYHISNASLSNRNPGANVLALTLALPLRH